MLGEFWVPRMAGAKPNKEQVKIPNPAVNSAIVGVRTVKHLDILERAAELKLEPEHLARLDQIFNINHGRPLKSGEAPEAFAW